MNTNRYVVQVLSSLQRYYESGFANVARTVGLERFLGRMYRVILSWITVPVVEYEIGGVSASFLTETPAEIRRFSSIDDEQTVVEDLLRNVERDDVFYDVGANVGLYTCFVARASVDRIFSFEPHPTNARRLRENLDLNGSVATVFECALADESGTFEMSVKDSESGIGRHSLADGDDDQPKLPIDVTTGDTLIGRENVPPPDVLKIDVEGAELRVLEGFKQSISSGACRLVYCEVHTHDGNQPSITDFDQGPMGVYEFFDRYGFTVREIQRRENDFHLKAVRESIGV